MADNVREGRQSLTKKISFHEKHSKNYRTIESIEKQPTKKKITLNQYHYKKESHPFVSQNSIGKGQDRKIKSLSKYEPKKLSESQKKRSALGSEAELATIEGLLNRNMQMVKFSMSKERERIMTKQKYKRSEQVRSLLENKKMSSMGKPERRDTENSNRIIQPSKLQDSESNTNNRPEFKQINLSTIINSSSGKEYEITLEDSFDQGCYLYYQYLAQKEERLAQVQNLTTYHLKTIKEELNSLLEDAHAKFKVIHSEVGEMSSKNLLMIAAVLFQQGKWNDVIMYIGRVLDKTDGNIFLIKLPGPNQKPNQSLTFLNADTEQRHYNLNLLSYLNLAESYKNTNNFLCAVNIINKCQCNIKKYLRKSNSLKNLKQHYQTLQPKDSEDYGKQVIKKKSYMLSALRPEPTASKFKKHSHANSHNFSSIDFNKSKKHLDSTQRHQASIILEKETEQDNTNIKFASHKESLLIFQPNHQESQYELKEYTKELTALYLLLARLYIKIKSYDLAINAYKKCLEVNARKIEALLELASLYYIKYSSKKSMEWLQICLQTLQKQQMRDQRWQLDCSYIKYHQALILLQQNNIEASYQLFNAITVPQLSSQTNYYKAVIKLRNLNNENTTIAPPEKNAKIQSILMSFNQAITAFTSKEYLLKSYFNILLILVFEKKDYYGAQYEVNRFKKIMPIKTQNKEDERLGLSRISRIYQDEDVQRQPTPALWSKQSYFNLLFDIIDGIICILKMKISRGINIFKEVSLKIENNCDEIVKYYGYYYNEIIKLLLQFKFYGYYILREYQLSLKHVNKLLEILEKESKRYKDGPIEVRNANNIQLKLININKLMLECIILMKQSKFNYAMSKLTQIQSLLNQPGQSITDSAYVINSAFILNNFNMMKALCFINLYTQLEHQKASQQPSKQADENDENNKEILLSAEELLRHCLISDKENSLIYYLISVIYYELDQHQSSLKYIREALQYSDDHMIKHYFSKANTKFMLGRYDQAIKDYTNAVIVYKEQVKNDVDSKITVPAKKSMKTVHKEESEEEYYSEKQIMFNEIYLNRAITYLKYAYQLSQSKNYSQNSNIISGYKMKACQDLVKYFHCLSQSKSPCTDRQLRNQLLLFLHTDDPGQLIEVNKLISSKYSLISDEDIIKVYYSIKELNNCILAMRNHIAQAEHRAEEMQQQRIKKDNLPLKHKKISMTLPKKTSEALVDNQKLSQQRFDLRCLEALKKSSSKSQGALEQALISLLEMTEEIYRKREEQISVNNNLAEAENLTLQNLFLHNCGEIFKWSDILFFIGVIHFQLKEYQTAIKYFEQSENEKKANGTLYSLGKYLNQVLKKNNPSEEEQEYLFFELQSIFQNRIYCKEQLDYNIGICYLMLRKYKQAYYYLQNYPHFLLIIKKAITIEKETSSDNEFITKEQPIKRNFNQILIDDHFQESQRSTKRYEVKRKEQKQPQGKAINTSNLSSLSDSVSGVSQKSSIDNLENITPFPTHNRLCSIYSPKVIDQRKFYLSFCLPKVELPLLGIFHKQQIQPAEVYTSEEQSSVNSNSSRVKDLDQERPCKYPVQKRAFQSVARHISLLDLQMKPIAPWIRQNTCGVIFTQNLINESVDLNSERAQKRKQKQQAKDQRKGKKQRYNESESRR